MRDQATILTGDFELVEVNELRSRLDLIAVAGATAVGKTGACVELARVLGSELVSADSMQVYRALSIGTAKPTAEELGEVRCRLVDHVEPGEQYSLGRFVGEADNVIREIKSRGRVPIVCGGTGLYLKGLLEGVFAGVGREPETRLELEAEAAAEGGLVALRAELERVDPVAAARIAAGDRQRLLRALEVYRATGSAISSLQRQAGQPWRYRAALIILNRPRHELIERINSRVDAMLAAGWLEEIERYLAEGHSDKNPAFQAVGYRELTQYLRGASPREEAVAAVKRRTRQFAKRQLTWFRGMKNAQWLDVSGLPDKEIAERIAAICLAGPGAGRVADTQRPGA